MTKCIVVLRKLTDTTVVSAVFKDPEDSSIDDIEHYLNSRADSHIEEFCAKFPEFRSATFQKVITELE